MVFLAECIAACALFTLFVKLATWQQQAVFTNDYPPIVTRRLRVLGLIAEKPPVRKQDYLRKSAAMVLFTFLFALLLRHVNQLDSFCPAALPTYGLWLVVDWFNFAVVDVLLAPFDRFYHLSGVSAFAPEAVRFHFAHSIFGMALGLPVAMIAGLLVQLM